jgi:histidine triad (HIT) family protein
VATKPCVFCRIVQGELPTSRLFEDDHFLAFLDHSPRFPGHCLLIPKVHAETLLDLPPDLGGPLIAAAQRLGRAVEKGLGSGGFFVAINHRVSQSVPHLHVHIIPRHKGDDFRTLYWPRHRYAEGEEEQVRQRLVAALEG